MYSVYSMADRKKNPLGDNVLNIPWCTLAAVGYTIYMHCQYYEISLVYCITLRE